MTNALANTLVVAVSPGVPVRLLAAAPAGMVIINNDTTDAVWISDQPGVIPGAGLLLAVGGTITWAKDGAAIYACVDTGVTSPVSIALGASISDYQNPFGVGLAVAEQLLIGGVPNVLTTTVITTTDTVTGGNSKNYDVSKYASLIIGVSVTGNATANYGVSMRQGPTVSGALNAPTSSERLAIQPNTVSGTWTAAMVVPVTGPVMVITNEDNVDGGASVATLTIIGSNRPVARPFVNNRFTGMGIAVTRLASAMPVGSNFPTAVSQQTVSGPATIFVSVSDTLCAFRCRCSYSDGLGNELDYYVFTTADLDVTPNGRVGVIDTVLPMNLYGFVFDTDIASIGNVDISLRIMSSQ